MLSREAIPIAGKSFKHWVENWNLGLHEIPLGFTQPSEVSDFLISPDYSVKHLARRLSGLNLLNSILQLCFACKSLFPKLIKSRKHPHMSLWLISPDRGFTYPLSRTQTPLIQSQCLSLSCHVLKVIKKLSI